MPLIQSDIDELERESSLKGKVESDLKYQVKKVLYVCEQLGLLLDRQYENNFFYHDDARLAYFFEFLTGELERLIHFYYKWILICGLGLKEAGWRSSKSFFSGSSEEVFNAFSHGAQMDFSEEKFSSCEESKRFFENSTKFLFSEGIKEIIAIGYMIKNSRCRVNYLPKVLLQKESNFAYVPLLYLVFNNEIDFFEACLSQELLSCDINDDHQIDDEKRTLFFADTFNKKSEFLGWASSNMRFFDFDGVEFVVSKGHVGVSLESFIQKAYDMCRVMSGFVVELNAGNAWASELDEIVQQKTHRKPRTLKNSF